MIAKINPNRTFAVLAEYTNNKEKDARVIAYQDVCIVNNQAIADSFEAQAAANKRVRNPCKHISLSFSPEDATRMTDDFMAKIAKEYIERMGIRNTQYIVVRHNDKDHPHCHIVYNRVDNDGKSISDSNNYRRSQKIAYALTVKYGLHIAKKSEDQNVKRYRLKGKDKTKYRIKDKVCEARAASKNWRDFRRELDKRGIKMNIYVNKASHLVRGVSFAEGIRHLTGSKLNANYPLLSADFGDVFQELCQDVPQETFNAAVAVAEKTAEVVCIGLDAIVELALQPHQAYVSVSGGGGTSNSHGWNDNDKKRKKNDNSYKPFKFGR